jgi:LPS sulfotransferase NodH
MENKGATAMEQIQWAKQYWTKSLINKAAARGFKTKLVNVLDQELFKNLLIEKNVQIIQMMRQNRVKAVVSKINAKRLHDQSGYWNLYKETDRMPPMEIKLEDFQNLLTERENLEAELNQFTADLPLNKMVINYEDLLSDREAVLKSLFKFLNVEYKLVESKTLKHTSDDLRDVVLNFDELKNHYKNTIYEPMFEEVIQSSEIGMD